MKKFPVIKTVRLRKAIDAYFEFKHKLLVETGDVSIPSNLSDDFDKVCNEVLDAAHSEEISAGIVAGTIIFVQKMGLGRKRSCYINSVSKFHTASWNMMENLF